MKVEKLYKIYKQTFVATRVNKFLVKFYKVFVYIVSSLVILSGKGVIEKFFCDNIWGGGW